MLPVAVEQDEGAPGVSWTNWWCTNLKQDVPSAINNSCTLSCDKSQIRPPAQGLKRALGEILVWMAQDNVHAGRI